MEVEMDVRLWSVIGVWNVSICYECDLKCGDGVCVYEGLDGFEGVRVWIWWCVDLMCVDWWVWIWWVCESVDWKCVWGNGRVVEGW